MRLGASLAIGAAALLTVLLLAVALATGGRGHAVIAAGRQVLVGASNLAGDARALADDRFAGLGLTVNAVHLQGASRSSQAEILQAAAIHPGEAILGLDLNAIRARVERVGWVDNARVIRLFPDTIVIAVKERPLMAVWQHHGRQDVVTVDGHVVGAVEARSLRGLPLIVGDGANLDAQAILAEVASRPRLASRIWAVRRVDGRRWDLVLKDGCVILLPADDEAGGLARLDALDRASKVLELGLARVDLREPNFTVVRPRTAVPTTIAHGV